MDLCRVMRRAGSLAVLVLAAAGGGWSAAAPTSGYVEYERQVGQGAQQQKQTIKVWFKGQRQRHEMSSPQGAQIQLILPDAVYVLMPGNKVALKQSIPPAARAAMGHNPFGNIEQLKQRTKKVGSEKVGTYQTDIYEQTSAVEDRLSKKTSQVATRFSIAPGVPVPVKIVQVTPMGLMVTELKSIQVNNAIPDSMFQLPKGIKVTTSTTPLPRMKGKGGSPGAAPH